MLFVVTEHALTVEGALSDTSIEALENLVRAHREGKHALLLPKCAERLRHDARLSKSAHGAIRSILSQRSELAGLQRSLPVWVELVPGNDGISRVDETAATKLLRAGLDWFAKSERSRETILLGESLVDTDVYALFGRLLLASLRWRNRLVFERRGGGGGSIRAELCSIADRFVPALCIVDSDRSHPTCTVGSTASAVHSARGELNFQDVLITKARELENLLPLDLALGALEDIPGASTNHIKSLQCAVETFGPDCLAHVDLKVGLVGAHLSSASETAERAYLISLFGSASTSQCRPIQDQTRCARLADCDCRILPSIGASTATAIVAYCTKITDKKLAERIQLRPGAEVLAIAEIVVSWGCAAPARAA